MSEKTEGIVWEDFLTYTESELDDFAERLEKFRVKHSVTISKRVVEKKMMEHPITKRMEMREVRSTVATPSSVSFIDENAAGVAFGALRKGKHLGHDHYFVVMQQTEKSTAKHGAQWAYPSKYDIFQNKLGSNSSP